MDQIALRRDLPMPAVSARHKQSRQLYPPPLHNCIPPSPHLGWNAYPSPPFPQSQISNPFVKPPSTPQGSTRRAQKPCPKQRSRSRVPPPLSPPDGLFSYCKIGFDQAPISPSHAVIRLVRHDLHSPHPTHLPRIPAIKRYLELSTPWRRGGMTRGPPHPRTVSGVQSRKLRPGRKCGGGGLYRARRLGLLLV